MSQLERSQFQARSGLPRLTRSGIPTPLSAKSGGAKPATSRAVNGDAPNGRIPNGRSTVEDLSSKHCNVNGTSCGAPSHKTATRNVASPPSTASQNGHVKVAASAHVFAPRSGGVLTTTTTTHLRNLANARQANGSNAAAGAVPKVPAKVNALTAARSTAPVNRKPISQEAKKDTEPVMKAKAAESARKPTAPSTQSLGAPSKSSRIVMRPVTLSARKPTLLATTAKPIGQKASPAAKAPAPTERPLGPNQERCDVCGRGFDRERIEKHREICKKAASKKVKVFDATKMRTKGTEVEAYVKRGLHKKEVPVKKSNWRAAHEEFIQTVRQAKVMQEHLARGGKLSDLPPPPPSSNPDYVPCPHCGRKFNEAAAERHIPRCKEVSVRKRPPTAVRK